MKSQCKSVFFNQILNPNFRAIFSPADLIIKNISAYADSSKSDKIQTLHDFLADIMSIVSLDAKSTKTFNDIETSITQILDMEKKLAKIMCENGYQKMESMQTLGDKKKFNDLPTTVSAVTLTSIIEI